MYRHLPALLLLASVAVARPPGVEPPTVSDGGRYVVAFPVKANPPVDREVVTDAGTLAVTTQRVESGGVQFAVSYTDYPDSFRRASGKDILDGAAKALAADGSAGVTPFTQNGVPGRTVAVSGGENEVRARLYLDGRRLYVVVACGPQRAMRGSAAEAFIGSFGISK